MPSEAKILIVDDHEDTLYALESALAPLGYRLTRATSGDAALKEVLRGQVGLLLLDVRMPGVSGLDVVRCLRGLEQTQHIPVILLTGFGPDAELTATAFRLGVADLVMKPVDPWACAPRSATSTAPTNAPTPWNARSATCAPASRTTNTSPATPTTATTKGASRRGATARRAGRRTGHRPHTAGRAARATGQRSRTRPAPVLRQRHQAACPSCPY